MSSGSCGSSRGSRSRSTGSAGMTVVRVSVQAYTTDEDCEALVSALETML